MEIKTKFFGEITIAEGQIIIFPYGIYGFESFTRFVLLHDEEDEEYENSMIFRWLQCVDDENLCFTVMEPEYICKEYNPKLPANSLNMLKKPSADSTDIISIDNMNSTNSTNNTNNTNEEDEDDLICLVIAVIYENINESTANTLGPIIINSKTQMGAQIILESSEPQNSEYKIKHKIFDNLRNQ